MKYVSLFAGIGGFDLALNRLGHECVYANEWDKYAAQTYEKNFTKNSGMARERERSGGTQKRQEAVNGKRTGLPQVNRNTNDNANSAYTESYNYAKDGIDTGSITDIAAESIPDHDLLVGGFPCQAFSVAGKRRGFDDTRGTLFFDIARILSAKRPRLFLFENVKGLLSHDNGKTFATIISTLTELGYDVEWQVLNSKNFGVPQNRERVFIVGHLRGEPRPQVFPITEDDGFSNTKQQKPIQRQIQTNGQEGDKPNSDGKILETGKDRPLYQRYPLKFLNRNQRNIEGDYAYTIDGANTGGVRQDMKIRRLTPIECERLQGFPDNWTQGVSDTQRYKQLGNAVTVNVVYEVAKRLTNL